MHLCGDISNSKYRARYCMIVVMLVTVNKCYILHVYVDGGNSKYRATYYMHVVILVTVCLGLHAACMW